MTRLPVIIPYYRERDKLERCLAHLRAQSHTGLEVFVRDNSVDNVLFTAAVNEGLRKYCYDASVPYVLVLNQDAYLAPDAIGQLVDFLEHNPGTGIACPLQLTNQGGVIWGGSLSAFPTGMHRCDPVERYTEPVETYWANGAALLLRTELVREVGLWDKNLRFICSDTDFSFSARARGWKIHLVPAARCEHTPSGSAADVPLQLQIVKHRDALYFANKWLSGDLFRSLSFEGSKLTAVGVRYEIERIGKHLLKLEKAASLPRAPF